ALQTRPCSRDAIPSRVAPRPVRRLFREGTQAPWPAECGHPRRRDSVLPIPRQRFSLFRRRLSLLARRAAPSEQSRYNTTSPTNLLEMRRLGCPATSQLAAILLGICVRGEIPQFASR